MGLVTSPCKTDLIIKTGNSMITGYNGYSTTIWWTPDEAFINWTDCVMTTLGEGPKGSAMLICMFGLFPQVSSDGIPQYAQMNDQEVAEQLVTGIDSAFLARHSQDGDLFEWLQASAGASCMVSSVGIPQSAPIHGQVSTRGPFENDCVCREVIFRLHLYSFIL
ncbi:uncharacterized protein LOC110062371 [Orbicella faveolata]|uniref:uncharacterized protein LOC110062371 n=1 Tax=Orbicella faveolata TaxID=48498 RepID=UPI0009E2C7C7|nr:uncharacterized protein LOC110062371 [Orbicella faveolata]